MDENYRDLAEAIIIQAAKDYQAALRVLKKRPNDIEAKRHLHELERFFCSEWYQQLSDTDGETIMRRVREMEAV